MHTYIASERKDLLEANHLSDFDHLWACQSDWFEVPNNDRKGWSGVNHLFLQSPGGNALGVFLKRQQNYVRRTFLHPFTGESTFACEFKTMMFLIKRGVPVPKPVFFDEKSTTEGMKAILMTEELANYQPLDQALTNISQQAVIDRRLKRNLLKSVAQVIHKLHYARIQHRALYPKHLFVDISNPNDVRTVIIDLEKARIKFLPIMRTLQDFGTLNRDLHSLSHTDRLYLFKQYYGAEKLGFWGKLVFRLVEKRSVRRAKTKAAHQGR